MIEKLWQVDLWSYRMKNGVEIEGIEEIFFNSKDDLIKSIKTTYKESLDSIDCKTNTTGDLIEVTIKEPKSKIILRAYEIKRTIYNEPIDFIQAHS